MGGGQVVGWVHVHLRLIVESGLRAEVAGLVVDERYRGAGIGRLLIRSAEQWALRQGCWAVHIHSNVVREGALAFYEKIGYRLLKTQRVLQKVL
jgi:GNAT superfamily N-acetyltransferase